MPFNGSGTYDPPSPEYPAVAGTLIESADFNTIISDIATGLSNAVTRDGQSPPTANLPMATFRHTGVGAAVLTTDYARALEVQNSSMLWGGNAAGTADALTVNLTPAITAYVTGQNFQFKATATNTGAATLNINSLGAKTIQKNLAALVAGDITNGDIVEVVYDGTNFQMKTGISAAAADVTNAANVTDGGGIGIWKDKSGTTLRFKSLLGTGLATPSSGTNDVTLDVPIASQAEAEAGSINTKAVTPLRVSQEITALVLNRVNSYTKQQGFGVATLTDAATIAWNLNDAQSAQVTLGGNRTLGQPSNIVSGNTYILVVKQDGTGSRTLAFHADYLFPGGTDPTLSTGANAIDVLTFVANGTKLLGVAQLAFA